MEPSNDVSNGHSVVPPPEIERAIKSVHVARNIEAALVALVCVGVLLLTGSTAYNSYRLKRLINQNQKSQQFGLLAVECILDNFAEHRWSNQVFHDQLGDFLHAPRTPHTPLPNLPNDEQFKSDCEPFNKQNVIVASSSTTTTTGVHP